MLIVLEGIDGCGKTTVGEHIAKRLGCDLKHFPDDGAVTGPLIRSYLRQEWRIDGIGHGAGQHLYKEKDSALVFQALQITNRMESMELLTRCAGNPSEHLVLSRYWQSAVVYGAIDGLDVEWLEEVHASMTQADLNIFLYIDPAVAMLRLKDRDGTKAAERYEAKLDFLAQADERYRELWDHHEGLWVDREGDPRWQRIDTGHDFEVVCLTAWTGTRYCIAGRLSEI